MKLLLDENISRRIVPLLSDHFPESTQVALIGLERATDLEVWKYAKNNDYVLVTHDSDFYDLAFMKGSPPKIIWLKTGNITKQEIVNLLILNKDLIYERQYDCIILP